MLLDGRICAIELKGCLDGNNTNIFERPTHVQEFVMWSVCSSAAADPRHNVCPGIHTRLSAEIIEHQKQVDCLGQYHLTPPSIYLYPRTVPAVRNNPDPEPHTLDQVGFLKRSAPALAVTTTRPTRSASWSPTRATTSCARHRLIAMALYSKRPGRRQSGGDYRNAAGATPAHDAGG